MLPLHLYIKGVIANSYRRLRITETLPPYPPLGGHVSYANSLLREWGMEDWGRDDEIKAFRAPKPKYKIDSDSFLNGEDIACNGHRIYTDGSLIDGRSGSGFVILPPGHPGEPMPLLREREAHLGGKEIAVFQAELYAIVMACTELQKLAEASPEMVISTFSRTAKLPSGHSTKEKSTQNWY